MLFGAIPLAISLTFFILCFLYAFWKSLLSNNLRKQDQRAFILGMIGLLFTVICMEKTQRVEYKPYPFSIYDGGDYLAVKVKDQPTILLKSENEMNVARKSKFIYEKKIWKYMGTKPIFDWTFVKPDSDRAKEVK